MRRGSGGFGFAVVEASAGNVAGDADAEEGSRLGGGSGEVRSETGCMFAVGKESRGGTGGDDATRRTEDRCAVEVRSVGRFPV